MRVERALELQRIGAAAFEAGAMSRRERGRLIQKEQFRVTLAPNLAAPTLEFANAGDPLPARPAAARKRAIRIVKAAAAIAHQSAARSGGDEFAEGIDPVLQRTRRAHCVEAGKTPGSALTLASPVTSTP